MDVNLHFSLFDFLIGGVLIWGIYKGYMQGFIVQSIALFALLAGIFIAGKLAMNFYNLLIDKSAVPLRNLPVIAFAIMFAPLLYGTNWVALAVLKQVSSVPKNMYAKILGAFFGAVKYLVIASVFMLFTDRLDKSFSIITENEHRDSKLYKPVLKFAPSVISVLRFDIREPVPMELDDVTIDQD
jgi:membrane protein required for colicin V production